MNGAIVGGAFKAQDAFCLISKQAQANSGDKHKYNNDRGAGER